MATHDGIRNVNIKYARKKKYEMYASTEICGYDTFHVYSSKFHSCSELSVVLYWVTIRDVYNFGNWTFLSIFTKLHYDVSFSFAIHTFLATYDAAKMSKQFQNF